MPSAPEPEHIKTTLLAEAPDFFGLQALAKILGINKNAAYNMAHIEGFPVLKVGRKYIISKTGLARWLEKNIE